MDLHSFPHHPVPLAGLLLTCAIAGFSGLAVAQEDNQPLTEATIDRLVNTVTVELKPDPVKYAAVEDVMLPGDLLATGARALAQTIFNDRSLMRVGQNSLFEFVADSRQMILEKGVGVLVVPQGASGAEIVTPSAVAGVQGSLLKVNSQREGEDDVLEVATFTSEALLYTLDRVEIGRLQPGQVAIVRNGEVESIQEFDRCNALDSDSLLEGLHPDDDLEEIESTAAAEILQEERQILIDLDVCNPDREIVSRSPADVPVSPVCQQILDLYLANVRSFGRGGWQPEGRELPPGSGRFRTQLVYDLLRNGTVENIRVVTSSGHEPLDRSAVDRVKSLQGFPDFPSCYTGNSLEVDHSFTLLLGP